MWLPTPEMRQNVLFTHRHDNLIILHMRGHKIMCATYCISCESVLNISTQIIYGLQPSWRRRHWCMRNLLWPSKWLNDNKHFVKWLNVGKFFFPFLRDYFKTTAMSVRWGKIFRRFYDTSQWRLSMRGTKNLNEKREIIFRQCFKLFT